MDESFEVSTILPATAKQIYNAWLSSGQHAAFTGSPAQINPKVDGAFSAWDGYIQGHTLEMHPFHHITQAWRTTEFPEGCPDSRLEIFLEEVEGGTRITLKHSDIPEGQGENYKEGWEDYYFKPMKEYFNRKEG